MGAVAIRGSFAAGACALACLAPLLASGQARIVFKDGESPTQDYLGTRDVKISSQAPYQNLNRDALHADGSAQPTAILISFDLGSVPSSATVVGAALSFRLIDDTPYAFPAYEVLRAWTEGDATWTKYDLSSPWEVPGASGAADRGSVSLATIATNAALGDRVEFPLSQEGISAVQRWVQGLTPNHGFIIADYQRLDGIGFNDREGAVAARPAFVIDFYEGRLVFSRPGNPLPSEWSEPITVERVRYDGSPFSGVALPELIVRIGVSSATGELLPSQLSSPAPQLQVVIPAGATVSGPFQFRDAQAGQVTLTAQAGPAWASDALALTVGGPASPSVQLEASLAEGTSLPGAVLQLSARVRNDGLEPTPPLYLALELLGLVHDERASDLTECGGSCYFIGSIAPGELAGVNVPVRVTAQPGGLATVSVRVTDAAAEVAKRDLTVEVSRFRTGVGCGCGGAPVGWAPPLLLGWVLRRGRRA